MKRKIGILWQKTLNGYDLTVGHIFNMDYTTFATITSDEGGCNIETIFGKKTAQTLSSAKRIAQFDLMLFANQIVEALEEDIS